MAEAKSTLKSKPDVDPLLQPKITIDEELRAPLTVALLLVPIGLVAQIYPGWPTIRRNC
jgi:hypothetical protein